MIVIKGGVTTARGFLANGIAIGIKASGKKDLGLLYSEVPAQAAAAFTTNRFQASPIKISRLHLRNKTHQAVIVNSGNANCANGKAGDRDAFLMTEFAAKILGLRSNDVLVASTGIIGHRVPTGKIKKNMPGLVKGLSAGNGGKFSEAILTTDTVKKELAVKVKLGGYRVAIGGAAKGVGMIYPELKSERHATMLSFLTTDAAIKRSMLEEALNEAISDSFNMVSVDGDMSTNDSCFLLANGMAGNKRIDAKGKDYGIFLNALKFIMKELAKKIVEDGEGATKLIEIEVRGAANKDKAKRAARKISTSNLLKACVHGEDPNWGRVVAACGASGIDFNPGKVDVYLGGVKAMSNGASVKNFDREKARSLFKKDTIHIAVDLKNGRFMATAWTCDLSKEYVEINAEYST